MLRIKFAWLSGCSVHRLYVAPAVTHPPPLLRACWACRVAQQAAQITQLQGQLQQAQAALQEWLGTFEEERQGIFSGVVGQIHPLTVLNELRR